MKCSDKTGTEIRTYAEYSAEQISLIPFVLVFAEKAKGGSEGIKKQPEAAPDDFIK